VRMTISSDDLASNFLTTDASARNPWVFKNFSHRGSFLRINFQHAAHDMSALSWQKT